jgi:MFS family permease
LLRLSLFREPGIGTGFVMSALVNVVAMTTLVIGPFHLARALGLGPAAVGLVMTSGPLVAALVGVPAGRAVDRFGSVSVVRAGLLLMAAGCLGFALSPSALGLLAYVLPLMSTTAGFAIFQAANNTAVVTAVPAEQRGLVSALLTLSRNLGLVTGASAMGAVFLAATGVAGLAQADAASIASSTRVTFAVGLLLLACATALAWMPARAVAGAPGHT